MATKNQAPDAFQKQFNKIQFKINAPVIFTWLGMKKYGYVIRTKETNWGIQYTVQDVDAKYPCGIVIKTHKTTYNTGCILYDDSRSIGEIELTRRLISPTADQLKLFLETPEGQTVKAEAMISMSHEYLIQLCQMLQQKPTLAQQMIMNLAIHECATTIQKNEQILNLIPQSKNKKIS